MGRYKENKYHVIIPLLHTWFNAKTTKLLDVSRTKTPQNKRAEAASVLGIADASHRSIVLSVI
jgi:hypothetical protein